MDQPVRAGEIAYALRRMRPGCLRIDERDGTGRIALVMDASPAGRRNAAEKIVGYLGAHGLRVDAADPVGALTEPGTDCAVLRATPA